MEGCIGRIDYRRIETDELFVFFNYFFDKIYV